MYAIRSYYGALVRGNAERALCMNVTSVVRNLTLLTPTGGESLCAGTKLVITSYSIHYTKLYEFWAAAN